MGSVTGLSSPYDEQPSRPQSQLQPPACGLERATSTPHVQRPAYCAARGGATARPPQLC